MPLVFVYGTLMRGGCRSPALASETFVAVARTQPRYRMYNCGSFPGLVEARDGVAVEGEVWRVSDDCLAQLDRIEWVHEGMYERCPVALHEAAVDEPVEAYFYRHDVTGMPDLGAKWRHR